MQTLDSQTHTCTLTHLSSTLPTCKLLIHRHTHARMRSNKHTHTYSPLFNLSSLPFNPLIHSEQFFILVEFASGGNLLSYLKQMRKDRQTMSWSKGLGFALQIANGMAHLADKEVCVHTYIRFLLYIGVHMYVHTYIRMYVHVMKGRS